MGRRWLFLSALLTALGCTGVPDGLQPVRGFQTSRYLGTWYEIARLDHRFERGLEDVSATYSMREDGGIRVENRGYDPAAGEWREAVGTAYLQGDPTVASLKVSFFGPFYGGYHVIALDEDRYDWAIVTGPDRSYLWFLAREKTISPARRDAMVAFARSHGFDVEALEWVAHSRTHPALVERVDGAG